MKTTNNIGISINQGVNSEFDLLHEYTSSTLFETIPAFSYFLHLCMLSEYP